VLAASTAVAAEAGKQASGLPDLNKASWIWLAADWKKAGAEQCCFRKTFELPARPKRAVVLITADNDYELFVNGTFLGGDGGYDSVYWQSVEKYDVGKHLVAGKNALAVRARTLGGGAGLVAAARVEMTDGTALDLRTDGTWRVWLMADSGWEKADFDDAQWKPAVVLGPLGKGLWGRITYPGPRSPNVRRRPMFVEPGPDFDWPAGVVFVRDLVPMGEPANFTVRVAGSRAYFEHDAPSPAVLGRRLYSLVPARPDGKLRLLCDAGKGVIGSPSVSYDGKVVYFTMAPEGGKFLHVYRISADGSGLRALTQGPYHDMDPAPLPDGRIVFSSTRVGSRDEYHGNLASSLFTMAPDGSAIRPLTHHIVADHEPKVTASGGIAFIRCDNFFERAKVETRIHHVRLDGTGGIVILGADRGPVGYDRSRAAEHNSAWLRRYGFGSPAPLADGRIAAISNFGLVATGVLDSGASELERIPVAFTPFDMSPLPDGRLLCTTGRRWLGVMDPKSGQVAKVYSLDGLHSAVHLGPRARPPVMSSRVSPAAAQSADKTGYLFCQNVLNTKQTNADLSRIKAVRVYEGRPFTMRSVKHRFVHIGVEAVELGTVPLAPDGSFYVRVPADRALAIQAVDAEGRSVISELSWIYVRPGEQRSCVGCHNPRISTPSMGDTPLAAGSTPLTLTAQGDPHRFRGNNAGNGGVLNLQMDRFREAAAINLYPQEPLDDDRADVPLPPGRPSEVARLCRLLAGDDDGLKISSARRLAILRDRAAVPALIRALGDDAVEVRVAAALGLSSCGDRDAVKGLLEALTDAHPLVAQAANVALENVTGHSVGFNAFLADRRQAETGKWRSWLKANNWPAVEAKLVARLSAKDPASVCRAIEALGHVGDKAARTALRDYVAKHPDGELRTVMAAVRALGHLQDRSAVPLLADILNKNMRKDPGKPLQLHELGWLQKPLYLASTAAEALGWIGTPQAEKALADAFPKLLDFWRYTHWTGDHVWLMGCHSSVLHYRMLEAFDAMGSRVLRDTIARVLRSVPMDPDRALLFEDDAYESLAARVVQRAGQAPSVIETCLAVLGDPAARPVDELKAAVTASPPAVSVKPQDPETRAAQTACVVCLDTRYAARLRAAFNRYRAAPPSRKRSWVCFFLARALGKIRDRGSVDALLAALEKDATEASFGFENPPNVFVYKAMTPFYRAAAADALGRIGDPKAVPALLRTAANLDNGMCVRHAAARSLGSLCGRASVPHLRKLAADYPEVATRRALLEACQRAESRPPIGVAAGHGP